MRVLIFLFFLTVANLFFNSSFSQNVTSVTSVTTPNPAQLVKDYQIPIDYYRGLPDIKVPLYTFKSVGLEVPIGLSYDASGVRIDQAPTWVGLGWSLTCGGVIVREVSGSPDELYPTGYLYAQTAPALWKINEAAFDDLTTNFNYDVDAGDACYRIINGLDVRPDKFVFSFNGITGEFYLDRNGNVVTNSKLSIEYVIDDLYPEDIMRVNYFKEFKIISEDGTRYIFGPRENQTSRAYWYGVQVPSSDSSHDTSWYLKKVESPDATSAINIEYSDDVANYSGLRAVTANEKHSITTEASSYVHRHNDTRNIVVEQGATFATKLYNDVEEVVFEATPFSGILMNQQLSKIKIRNKLTNEEWHYRFTYKNQVIEPIPIINLQPMPSRFQLESIVRGSGTTEETLYSFYYNSDPMGFVTGNINDESYSGIDHWGYNNGPKTYKTRIPLGTTFLRFEGSQVTPIDRSPNSVYTKVGSLEKIVIPTKGVIEFEFENNDYGYVAQRVLPNTKPGSGLRLKKMTYKDGMSSAKDIVKQYSYISAENPTVSSGVVPFEPVYHGIYNGPNFTSDFWTSSPILPISIGYSLVTETNADGGKTVFQFNSAREYPPTPAIDEFSVLVHAEDQRFFVKKSANIVPYLLTDRVNTHFRGTLRSKAIVDKNNTKLKETVYTYTTWTVGRLFNLNYTGFDINLNSSALGTPGGIPNGVGFLSKNFINVYHLEIGSETNYNYQPGSLDFLMDQISYLYNNFFFPKEIQHIRSDLKITKSIFTYPTDYNDFAMGESIGNMLNLKARGKVIESLKITDNKISEGIINEYDGYGRVTKQLNLETENGIEFSSYVLNPDSHLSLPGNYKERSSYKYYQGRLVEASENGSTSSWLWGYSNSRVIAKAENSKFENIFYTSFEDNGQEDVIAKSGKKIATGTYVFLPPVWYTAIANSKLSYWYYDASKWNYFEQSYSGGNVTITGRSKIDEVRIHPSISIMTTYTHDILNGLLAEIDRNNIFKRYEYDPFGRLKIIRDNDSNILKVLSYHITD